MKIEKIFKHLTFIFFKSSLNQNQKKISVTKRKYKIFLFLIYAFI